MGWTNDKHTEWKFDDRTLDRDAARDEALRFLRADYYTDVTRVAEDLMERARDGEFEQGDDLLEAMNEDIDSHRRVSITFLARLGLLASDSADFADEEGFEVTGPEGRMYFAMREDVVERMAAADFYLYEKYSWGVEF